MGGKGARRSGMLTTAALVVKIVIDLLRQWSNAIDDIPRCICNGEGVAGIVENGAGEFPASGQHFRPAEVRYMDGIVGTDVVPRVVISVSVVLLQIIRIDLADPVQAECVKAAVGTGVQSVAIGIVELQR